MDLKVILKNQKDLTELQKQDNAVKVLVLLLLQQEQRKQAVKSVKKQVTKNEVDTYVTLTFSSQNAKQDFMRKIGQPVGLLFIKGEAFVEKYFAQ